MRLPRAYEILRELAEADLPDLQKILAGTSQPELVATAILNIGAAPVQSEVIRWSQFTLYATNELAKVEPLIQWARTNTESIFRISLKGTNAALQEAIDPINRAADQKLRQQAGSDLQRKATETVIGTAPITNGKTDPRRLAAILQALASPYSHAEPLKPYLQQAMRHPDRRIAAMAEVVAIRKPHTSFLSGDFSSLLFPLPASAK